MILSDARRELYSQIPEGVRAGLVKYFVWGCYPGAFLTAVLTNNLKETFAQADENSARGLRAIMTWLFSFAPSLAHGSKEKLNTWGATLEDHNVLPMAIGLKEGLKIFQALGDTMARQAIEEIWGVSVEEAAS